MRQVSAAELDQINSGDLILCGERICEYEDSSFGPCRISGSPEEMVQFPDGDEWFCPRHAAVLS